MNQNQQNQYQQYIADLQKTLDRLPWAEIDQMVNTLHAARLQERHVFIIGNGGSASTASHMACDLGKNTIVDNQPRFRVISLTDNTATLSALANDEGYENVFAEQLANFVDAEDVIVAISASGNSENVLRAVRLANDRNATTIGLTGYQGGQLATLVDLPIVVDSNSIEQIEDVHLILEHMVTVALRRAAIEASQDAVLPV